MCLLALALLPFAPAPRGTAQVPGYTLTDLGTLGGETSQAFGIDPCGKVVGRSLPTPGPSPAPTPPNRPFLWSNGTMTDLGSTGGRSGMATAINQSGTTAGAELNSGGSLHAFVRNANGSPQDIGTLGGPTSVAYDINASGRVVGVAELNGALQDRAFTWQSGGGMQEITAPWGTPIRASGINDAGQVAGLANLPATSTDIAHAFVTIGGVPVDIGTLGGTVSFGIEVNDTGEVVGYSYVFSPNITQSFHAFRWKDLNGNGQNDAGEMIDLGFLSPSHHNSYAYDINNAGQVVGASETGSADNNVSRAFIWQDTNGNNHSDAGEMRDLNDVVPGTNWTFQEARGINDRGQIVGTGLNPDGKQHAFLLTPTDVAPSPCAGTVQFNSATYSIVEGSGTANITVTRTGGSQDAVSVNYATSDGTATAGSDYTAASGTLNFAASETSKTFTVTVSNDALDEPDKTVNLTLSNPGGGALLGAQSTAVLTIEDDDVPALSVNDVSVIEGNAGTTDATFTVSLSIPSWQTVIVNYETADGTAGAADYTATSGTVTFNPGQTSKTVTVQVKGDTTDELNETFNVNLSNPTNAAIDDGTGVGTINDDDGPPALSINDVTVTEGNAGTINAAFTVSLLPASGLTVSVNYATANGTATAGSDYAAASGTLTFNPGETSKPVNVTVNGDNIFEGDETFFVNLSGASNADVTDNQGRGTIDDDDGGSVFQFSSPTYSVVEGGGTATITVNRTGSTAGGVSVAYATAAGGTATAGSDYTATSGTLNFAASETSKTFTVNISNDALAEADEAVNLALGSPVGGTLGAQSTAALTINDNDAQLQFDSATYTVGEGGVTAIATVNRVGGNSVSVTVNYATSNGTATTTGTPGDYNAASGTLTFGPNETTKSFPVTINNDTFDEPDETVNLTLSSPGGGAALGTQSTATLTITDDDVPALSVNDVSVIEGNAGTTDATFTVSLSIPSWQTVIVNYETADGTAGAADYTATSGTVTFNPGQTSKTVTVQVKGDTTDEPDETFSFNLGSPTNATISDDQGIGTIKDDDDAPSISVNDVTVLEGNAGTANATFAVTLSAPSGRTVTVNYATSDGTATAGSDYTAVTSNTLTFNPGETSKSVTVAVVGDTLDEPNETFNVNLSSPTNASVNDGVGVGTITDDDAAPIVSVGSAAAVTEGDTGTTNATFEVTLSAASALTATVNFATAAGTANVSDFTAASGTLTFNPGETSKSVSVAVLGDTVDEANETFNLIISSPTNATLGASTGSATIIDDDGAPSLSIGDASLTEGNSGPVTATFAVTLLPASGQIVTVNYATADGTAAQPGDYAAASGTLTFGPGETSKSISVTVNGDTSNEPDETFFVNLSGAVNATIADNQGQGTIVNDDMPTLRFSQAAYPVGESAHFVTVTVTRAGDTAPAVGVNFATSDGTATERRDYTAVSGRLLFAAGETSKTFDVLLTEDAYTEPLETINLTLSNPTGGAALGTQAAATVNIAADDNPPPNFNPIDVSSEFVRQHYHDFLNREPDASGLAFWTGEIEQCGADAGCRAVKRINVSAAFFLSIEFQETGYLVYRTYKAAYGDATSPNVPGTVPVVRLQEFLPDTRSIGQGVQVGIGNWEQQLEANKNTYMAEFSQRQRFLTAFPVSLTAAQFVDKLNQNAGGVLTAAERDQLVNDLSNGVKTRAQVLRAVAENDVLEQQELRRAFVLMQFYGYLRRNPDDPQDVDFRGWRFWLDKLNDFNGNYVQAEMVKAFLDSIEYRTRFAP
ncbi:MAG: Calx-beta domain-containing protein [Pyrinomonadaceae bacterium]